MRRAVALALNRDVLFVCSSQEWNIPPEDSFLSGASPVAAPRRVRAEQELLPKARERLPLLGDWGVAAVEWGVRAQPPRTRHGRLPLLGRLPDSFVGGGAGDGDGSGDAQPPAAPVWWVFVGLGARGIVYHAFLGKALAAAVLGGDEGGLPEETRAVWQSALSSMQGGGEQQQGGRAASRAATAEPATTKSVSRRRGGGDRSSS